MTRCWLADSLRRFYPASGEEERERLALRLLRGERGSFQVVTRNDGVPRTIEARVEGGEAFQARVRRVGYVPMPHINSDTPAEEIEGLGHIPGFVPDPLFPESSVLAGPFETNSFWVSIAVPAETAPGEHRLEAVVLTNGSEIARLAVELTVHPAELPARRDFPVTNWFYADAIADRYRLDLWSEPFWQLLRPYLGNLVEHGQDTLLVPLFTPPTDGVKRPTQLLQVTRDGEGYAFEWSQVRRWLNEARAAGLHRFEWTHLCSQWGAANALRIYHGHGEQGELLWEPETSATSDIYRGFLGQFLPAFKEFLLAEGVLEASFFHLSDEPHGPEHRENYRAARAMLRELAPWMPVMDAMSEVEYATEGLTEMPVALLPKVPAFQEVGAPIWAYYCGVPRGRYPNRLYDTPLAKIRMTGWLLYRTGVLGFLHWAVNYWYRSQTTELLDPFQHGDAMRWPRWTYGDSFVVYPGPDGPLDSIRWEVFAESLQDYALLQVAGIDRNDPILAEIHDFADFPRNPAWITDTRAALADRLSR
jgi:hypothetical protein